MYKENNYFFTGCIDITDFMPRAAISGGSAAPIVITGAGLELFTPNVLCSMVSDTDEYDIDVQRFDPFRGIVAGSYPQVPVNKEGEYAVRYAFTEIE